MERKIPILFVFVLMFMIKLNVIAQPFNLTESVQPVELIFTDYKKEADEKAKGRISINTFTQELDTMYYFIKGLSMYSPTYFSLNTTDPDANIKVNLCKENWHKAHRTGEIKGKGIWKSNFKTEGDFGIMVIANKKPVRYVLLVWSGKEMNLEILSVFKTANSSDIKGESWFKKNIILVVGAAIALLIISFLLMKLKVRNR